MAETVEHSGDLREFVVFVDWAQVCNREIRQRDGLRPGAVQLNHREVHLLSACGRHRLLVLKEARKLLTQIELNRR